MDTQDAFDAYLQKKRIDAQAFAASDKALYLKWYQDWAAHHVNSFETRFKFQINPIRRRYPRSA